MFSKLQKNGILKILLIISFLLLSSILFPIVSDAAGGIIIGNGTSGVPFLIEDLDDLLKIRDEINSGNLTYISGYYSLKSDIDIGSIANWIPIGNTAFPFKGNFDGEEHEIYNLTYFGTDSYVGFFGQIRDAKISNLTIEGSIESTGQYLGGFAGRSYSDASSVNITNCINKTTLKGSSRVGGFFGASYIHFSSTIFTSCVNFASVSASGASLTNAGGFVGSSSMASNVSTALNFTKCSNNAEIGFDQCSVVGGLIGYGESTVYIEESANLGKISGSLNTGGLAGTITKNYSNQIGNPRILNSLNKGDIDLGTSASSARVGGIVGGLFLSSSSSGRVSHTYSSGSILGRTYIGGIVGFGNKGTVTVHIQNSVMLGQSIVSNNNEATANRVFGGGFNATAVPQLSYNYSLDVLTITNNVHTNSIVPVTDPKYGLNKEHGSNVSDAVSKTNSFWQTASNWTGGSWSSSIWHFEEGKLPELVWTKGANIISVKYPPTALLSGHDISDTVDNSVTTYSLYLNTNRFGRWQLYSDAACTVPIANNTLSLAEGLNTAYIGVLSLDETEMNIYTLNVTREFPPSPPTLAPSLTPAPIITPLPTTKPTDSFSPSEYDKDVSDLFPVFIITSSTPTPEILKEQNKIENELLNEGTQDMPITKTNSFSVIIMLVSIMILAVIYFFIRRKSKQ